MRTLVGKTPVEFSGVIERDRQHIKMQMQTQNLSLAPAYNSVLEAMRVLGLSTAGLAQFKPAGKASTNLQLVGPYNNLMLIGRLDLDKAGLRHSPSQLEISDLLGQLVFSETALTIKPLTGQFMQVPFSTSGQVTNDYRTLDVDFAASQVNLKTLEKMLATVAPQMAEAISLGGQADFNLHLGGTVEQPGVEGNIQLHKAQVSYTPDQVVLDNLVGALALTPDRINLQKIQGLLNSIPVQIEGSVNTNLQDYRIHVQALQINIAQLTGLLSTLSPQAGTHLQAADIRTGIADLRMVLSPEYPLGIGGTLDLKNVYATSHALHAPVELAHLHYDIGTGKISMPQGALQIGQLAFDISGFASTHGYKVRLATKSIPVEFLREEKAFLEQMLNVQLPTLHNTEGAVRLLATLSPAMQVVDLEFENAGASMEELKYPVYNLNGIISMVLGERLKAYTNNFTFRYGNSPVKISLDSHGPQDFYLETTGTMAPLLVNEMLQAMGAKLVAYAAVPFEINLSGSLGKLSGAGEGNNLNMFFNFNIASLFSSPDLEKPKEAGDASLDQATLSSVLQLVGNSLQVEQTRFKISDTSSILVDGRINEIFNYEKRDMALSVITEPALDLEAWGRQFNQHITEGLKGMIRANLQFISNQEFVGTQGYVDLDHIKSPGLEMEDLHGKITFDGLRALMDIEHILLPGVDLAFTAEIPNLMQYPVPIKDFNLHGQQFIVSLYTEWLSHVITGKLQEGIWQKFFPATGRQSPLPFEILNGHIQLTEGIINNLIVEDFTSNIRLYPNTYFELSNARAKSAGGHVKGHFAMNPRENHFMIVHLVIDKMKANAVSRILLNVSNQIFGNLSGTIDYTTQGNTEEEMMGNTTGSANLHIDDGRLPAIAKIENLLVAANTISGGIANVNLNSLFRLATPFNTNYFTRMYGEFKMKKGIIHIEKMSSNGENLDFHITGTIRMVDGYSDLMVRGRMDREIGGVLGPLGKLSVGRLFGMLPPLRKIIGMIPGIGFVPGFGGPRGAEGVAFEVKLEGPVLDPGSVQDFRWVQ
jgi:hypothetical protein